MGIHKLNQDFTTIVDDVDDDLLEGVRWSTLHRNRKRTYAIRWSEAGRVLLHRLIMSRILGRELKRSEFVDHINGDGLDNRRENLRLATNSQNQANSGIRRNNTTGYKGVSFHKTLGKWHATIMVKGKKKHLGYFDTPEEAAEAYNDAARKYFGEFAYLNEIERELD